MEKPLSLILFFGFLLLVFLGIFALLFHESVQPLTDKEFGKHTIYVNKYTPIHVIVADTASKKQKGLGGRDTMAPGEGMLFVFNRPARWRVWMRGMKFGLDILWLSEDGTVIDLKRTVYPESYPDVFEPERPAKYILEVLTGFSEANGIEKGTKIDLNL